MHVEIISEPAKLYDFAPEWDAFIRTQPNVTPFQTPGVASHLVVGFRQRITSRVCISRPGLCGRCAVLRSDICNWQDLARDTPLSEMAPAFRLESCEDTVCSEAELMPDFETYWQQRPHHVLRNVRRYGDKARSKYELSFCVSTEASPKLLETLLNSHAAQWNARGERGMVEANGPTRFWPI